MSIWQAAILGIVQGLTEFLPISSTAHLILVPWLFGWEIDPQARFAFDILLQLGTVVSVVIYFGQDLWGIARAMLLGLRAGRPVESHEARLGWLIVVATIPAALLGLLLQGFIASLHSDPPFVVAILLIVAAGLIFAVERFSGHTRPLESLTWVDAVIIGCSQALALFPGVSRSAATMSGGLFRGLQRPAAARFSFLMSIPILTGAGLLAVKDLIQIPNFTAYLPSLALGTLAAVVVGLASIHWLLGFLAKRSMLVFAWYRIGFGVLCLVIVYLR